MESLFQQNLTFLSEYDPRLAKQLRNYAPTGSVTVFPTPSGNPSLQVHQPDGLYWLHSRHDPMKEAQRWVEGLDLAPMYNLMVFGGGLLYHLFQLALKYQTHLQHLVVVERNLDTLHAAFSLLDLRPFLRTRTTFFLGNPSPIEIRRFMNEHLTPFVLDGLERVEHPASWMLDPDYYTQIRQVVEESLQSGEILLRTKVQLGGMIQENVFRNLPAVLSNPTASALGSLFSGVPAFVVGAGPSLDWNVDRLARVGERGVIIAVDTVLKKLRDREIHPHIVVTTDPTYLNAHHFQGIEDLGETVCVFSPSVYFEIPQKLKGTLISLPLPASRFMNALRPVLGSFSYMTTGINVGQTCFNLARYMGCDPIVLVGMDFSFPREGGTTHASGTALRRRIFLSETPGKMKVELLTEKPELEEFEPILIPGNRDDEVATNKFWFAYLRSMEEEIRKTSARVFNCTEGGARIVGAEVRTLNGVLDEFCIQERMVKSTLTLSVGFFFGSYINEGISVLQEAKEILDFAAEKAEIGLNQVDKLEKIYRSPSPDAKLLQEVISEITHTHKELIQNHKVYNVLDEAADRVLHPMLQQKSRPVGNDPTPENIEKTLLRYRAFFSGMKEIGAEFSRIAQETLKGMPPDSPPGF